MTNDSNFSYDVAKLLSKTENRLCADCNAPLSQNAGIHANMKFGVWICSLCSTAHKKELSTLSISTHLKKAHSEWSSLEIIEMQKARSNVSVNKVFERYIPSYWAKPHSLSTALERNNWIRAKYYSRLFEIPQDHTEIRLSANLPFDKRLLEERTVNPTILPTRIVDYFLVIGATRVKKASIQESKTKRSVDCLQGAADILESYPEKNYHKDTPIPDLVAPMVFSNGLYMSSTEKPPQSFTFVLTDINRIKLYGATLVFYELVDRDTFPHLSTDIEIQAILESQACYQPKALTVISHYPFYSLFGQFLEQLYRVSLSTAPLPIERYIANFMQELPLPPQGRIEVMFSLPQKLLQISRPPKNQLPMVDFSYRPLFAYLSVDNILKVFSCLCMELSVCICASNLAVLTPVQEALLSFLYPFVWQGCYVPILPLTLAELLDAPVPLLVGVHDSYLLQTPIEMRSNSTVFVHLDTDTISIGGRNDNNGDEGIKIPSLPKSKLVKLRQKLVEFGGDIHRKASGSCKRAGVAFPKNEHLTPIASFISEQGVISSNSRFGLVSSADMLSQNNKLGIKKPVAASSTASNKTAETAAATAAVPCRHPAASTLIASSNKNNDQENSILDAENNFSPQSSFNAVEIREAFFRFFVASFIDYQSFFYPDDSSTAKGGKRRGSFMDKVLKSRMSPPSKLLKDHSSDAGTEDGTHEDSAFHPTEYAMHLQDEFLSAMVKSQMFTNFISERYYDCEGLSEIRFFDEHILAKKNRSKLKISKESTPFLSDDTDYLRETFNVPTPSTNGIPPDAQFSYTSFPKLNSTLFGVPRKPRTLIEAPEIRRFQDQTAIDILVKAFKCLRNDSRTISSESSAAFDISKGSSNRTAVKAALEGGKLPETGSENEESAAFFEYAREKNLRILMAITKLQSKYKVWPMRKRFLQFKRSKQVIIRFYRAKKVALCLWRRLVQRYAVAIQSYWRRYSLVKRYKLTRYLCVYLQSMFHMRRARLYFLKTRSSLIRVQSRYRGFITRKKQLHLRNIEIHRRRKHILFLWCLERTPLRYRSLFWVEIDQPTYLHLAFYEEEILRLYDSLGCRNPNSSCYVKGFEGLETLDEKIKAVESIEIMRNLSILCSSKLTLKELKEKVNNLISESSRGRGAKAIEMEAQETAERARIYAAMKEDMPKARHTALFAIFNIENRKHRKRKLSQYVWIKCDSEEASSSAEVVLSVIQGGEGMNVMSRDWLQNKQRQRVTKHCREAVHACLLSIQRLRVSKS